MNDALLQVTERVLQRARAQGFTEPGEIRRELAEAGLAEDLWQDVLALARSSLRYEDGRYWYQAPPSGRAAQEKGRLDSVVSAIRDIIRQQTARSVERRGQERIEWIQPVVLLLGEEQCEHHVLSRDLSPTGIRLIGTRQLLGQKVQLRWPRPEPSRPWLFQVQILWTCAVGDNLFENGGTFLGLQT